MLKCFIMTANMDDINIVNGFLDFKNNQKKLIRGCLVMYDVYGYHKYIYEGDLFEYYLNCIK